MNETETTQIASAATPKRKKSTRILKVVGLAMVLVVLAGLSVHFLQHRDPATVAVENDAETLAEVGKLMILPSEKPIIATIDQADLVKRQPFYAGAENGDKLLIFPEQGTAIIYSPSRNVIVNAGPFSINSGTQ